VRMIQVGRRIFMVAVMNHTELPPFVRGRGVCETSSFLMPAAGHVQGSSLFLVLSSPHGAVDIVPMMHVHRTM